MEKVKINIVPKGLKPACYVSQNDNGRVVRFELFDELTPYTLDGSETITITVVRPDGVELVSSVVNTEDSYIDVVFSDDMTAIAGIADCELTITDGETVIGSRNFDMNIEIDAYNGKDVVIETATGVIASFNTEVEDNALEYESEIPYNAEGYTGLEIINSRTAPAYDKTPYLFRKTPSGYGNSCIEKLNGLSVAFNQLVDKNNIRERDNFGVKIEKNLNGSIKFSGTASDTTSLDFLTNNIAISPTHKYILVFSNLTVTIRLNNGGIVTYIDGANNNKIVVFSNNSLMLSLPITPDGSYNNDNVFFNIIDLTQMFGSTIADYIYSLETAQVGAGVAYFKNLFGADYYPYNAGDLISVKTSGRKTIGFNQWSEEWEIGGINAITGAVEPNNTRIRSTGFCPCLSATAYYGYIGTANVSLLIYWYDSANGFIKRDDITNDTVISPINARFFKVMTYDNLTPHYTDYKHDICINISDPERNGQYEPYNAVTYPLDPDLELRGIPKLDANNKLYGDGDIYESNGDVTRRYGIVDLGSLNWNYQSDQLRFATQDLYNLIKPLTSSNEVVNAICPNYLPTDYNTLTASKPDKYFSEYYTGQYFYIIDKQYTDAATFKASLDGVYLIYEKATPTSESADPYTDPQEARITEEFIDNRAIPIPVGHDTIYGTDIEYQDIDFDTTIFGGDINAIDGVLTSRYNSDGSVKTTPDVIELDPALIPVKAGDNNIFNSASGAQTIRYYNQED